jgi:hypothetical protein
MNLTTGHRKASRKGVALLSVIMTLCILALFALHPGTYAKAVLSALVVLCVFAMRRLSKFVPPLPANDLEVAETCIEKDEDTNAEDGQVPMEDIDFVTWMDEAIDSDTLLQLSENDRRNRHIDFMQGAMKKDKRHSHQNDL